LLPRLYFLGGGAYQWRVSSGPREPVTSKIKAVRRKYFLSFLPRPVWIIIIAKSEFQLYLEQIKNTLASV
jgi:hypothetical protein